MLTGEGSAAMYCINTSQHCFCLCLLSSLCSCLCCLSHSNPRSGRAGAIMFFLQTPFKFSLFKSRINLPFALALAIKLESSPMTSLIKKKGGDILISIVAIIFWPFVVSLVHRRVWTIDEYWPLAAQSHLQQKGSACIEPLPILDSYYKAYF